MDAIKSRLILSARTGKIAHAQLFSGRPGAPSLPLALAYATYLNCEDPGETDACGKCPGCLKNSKYIHPDLHFVFPVSATKSVKAKDVISQSFLKEWREFLISTPNGTLEQWSTIYGGENKQVNISKEESRQIIRNLSLKAFEGTYKIMLIWLPEYFHPSAANGILKILEEPPENTLFLLVSDEAEKLLPTILSRTQIVQIPVYTAAEIAEILSAENSTDKDSLLQIARLSDGDLSQARRLLENVESDQHQLFVEWMRLCYDYRRMDDLVKLADEFHRSSRIEQRILLQYALHMMRESLISAYEPQLERSGASEKQFISKFSRFLDSEAIEAIAGSLNEALFHLERNASAKMTFLDTSLFIMKKLRS